MILVIDGYTNWTVRISDTKKKMNKNDEKPVFCFFLFRKQ